MNCNGPTVTSFEFWCRNYW